MKRNESSPGARGGFGAFSWILGVTAVFGALFYVNAYVCDDAFISFRTVDNFVRGYGLRWNVEERVQSFTSPGFTLLLSPFYWLVHDRGSSPEPARIYWMAIALSFVLSLATLVRLGWGREDRTAFWMALAILMSSQAFVTFTSSGLETPLLYLLLVLFHRRFLEWPDTATRREYALALGIASLGLLTRLDAALLFGPAAAWIALRGWREHGPGLLKPLLLGGLPIGLWALFSGVYFGFPLPNTYYAKLGLDVDRGVLLGMGLGYLRVNFLQDPITLIGIALGAAAGWRGARARITALSGLLYVIYIVWIGGDFIGGRFLAPPLLLGAVAVLHVSRQRFAHPGPRVAAVGIAAALVYSLAIPSSPLRALRDGPSAHDVAFYYPASALRNWRPGSDFPFARFLYVESERHCKMLRAETFVVAVWGDGLNGFCRGPSSHLVDGHGITDPLMARLRIRIPRAYMPGHMPKPIPAGYIESILEQSNRIEDPDLAPYYDAVRLAVSGPLFSADRWRAMARLNLTAERRYRAPYRALQAITPSMRREAGRR